MRKLLFLLPIAALACGSVALPAGAQGACPPVIGERDAMLGVVNSIGLNNQTARLCGVPELRIKHKTEASMATLNKCLSERRITAGDISAEMQKGALAGKQAYEQSGNKALICEGVRAQFTEDE